jgi:dephospho-CoA kinase
VRTRVIGLTGGIGSGKSTVARAFADLGAQVIDADQVAREVVAPGTPGLAEVVAAFGDQILDGAGQLDRPKLGAIVFADPAKRKQLNGILHPRIAAETARRIAELSANGVEVVIYEATLIVENKVNWGLNGLIVVAASQQNQIARVTARDGFSVEEAQKRIDAQLPLEEKLKVADYVIDNDGDLEGVRRHVHEVWRDIQAGGPRH